MGAVILISILHRMGIIDSLIRRRAAAMSKRPKTIQGIYNIMKNIDVRRVTDPTSHVDVTACMEEMNKLTLEDVGLHPQLLKTVKDNMCMTICSTPTFNMAVFLVGPGKRLPLHDHPNMIVLSRLLHGTCHVSSFTPKDPTALHRNNSNASSILYNREVVAKTPSDATWCLSPTISNFHELRSEGVSILFDVLMPPYDESEQRPCNYYAPEAVGEAWRLLPVAEPTKELPYSVEYRGDMPEEEWGI